MKFALALVFLTVRADNSQDSALEDITAFNYLEKHGLPLAERIRVAEEAGYLDRIVGGSPVVEAKYPYQAGLLTKFEQGRSVCGGSLISNNRVLTAAHCWFDGVHQASAFTVVLGCNTLFSGGTRITTSDVVIHNAWNPTSLRNDLAIIRLPNPVSTSNNIKAIALPSGSQLKESFYGENATASGFGLHSNDGFISNNQSLSHVSLNVVSNIACSFSYFFIIRPSHVCTRGVKGHNICRGDSGGPLAIIRDGQPLLIGVASFVSSQGCQAGSPAGFSRVTSFIDWINASL